MTAPVFSSDQKHQYYIFAGLALFFVFYTGMALTPSHYALGLQALGIEASPLIGTARPIRSDEWIVLTPLFQTAVRGGFNTINQISPYSESLKGFWALPINDWSLIFKPQLWSFWVLPPAYAYSIYYALLSISFLLGFYFVFQLCGARPLIAIAISLALLNSHFVQVWWTSNAPTFAFSPWPVLIFVWRIRPVYKYPLLAWVSGVWLFGMVYPPYIISAAFAYLIIIASFYRHSLTVRNVGLALISVAITVVLFVFYYGSLIDEMAATAYPGQRMSSGGGVSAAQMLAHIIPFVSTSNFIPNIADSNACEIAVVSTLLPLIIIVFAKYSSLIEAIRQHKLELHISYFGILLMFTWMTIAVPANLGIPFLWHYVPAIRMAWGFGILITVVSAYIFCRCDFEITLRRVLLFSAILLLGLSISQWSAGSQNKPFFSMVSLNDRWFVFVPIVLSFAIYSWNRLAKDFPQKQATLLALFCALTGLFTFGTFNPVQQAHPIFDLPGSEKLTEFHRQAKENPNGWLVVPGMYGALFSGAGIKAINHTLIAPERNFFRPFFEELSERDFNTVFNRYAHIVPMLAEEPTNPTPDVIFLPIEKFRQ